MEVICINAEKTRGISASGHLTKGKAYTVVFEDIATSLCYYVINDSGLRHGYYKDRFIIKKELAKERLKDL
jgi:hypothetical protein